MHLQSPDFARMRKWWIGEVAGSPAAGRKGGVLILLRKNLPYHITEKDLDEEGRRISFVLQHYTEDHIGNLHITNIYAPNTPNRDYFNHLTEWFLNNLSDTHIKEILTLL